MKRHIFTALIITICAACGRPADPIEPTAQVATSTQAKQCGKDTDCKGDRICDSGRCVNPTGTQISSSGAIVTATQNTTMPIAGVEASATPKFKNYPARPVYTGPAAKLVLSNDLAKDYRTRLSEVLSLGKPTFAGEYVAASWGCGTSCVITAFVNKRTGKTLKKSFGGENAPYLTDFRIDSKLIVAEGYNDFDEEGANESGNYSAYFYVLEDDELKLIRKIPTKPSDDADEDGRPDGLWRP